MATALCFTYLSLQAARCAVREGHRAGVAAVLWCCVAALAAWALFPCDATLTVWALPLVGVYWRTLS